jgi:hypothetical protein
MLEYLDSGDGTWTESGEEEYNDPKAEPLDARVAGKDARQNSGWTDVKRDKSKTFLFSSVFFSFFFCFLHGVTLKFLLNNKINK